MNGTEPARRGNPFPATAVAGSFTAATVLSSALQRVSDILDEYVADPRRGVVVAVTGAVGSGKTHLANELATWVADRLPDGLVTRVDARNGFSSLCGSVLDAMEVDGLRAQIDGYYRDVVVELLRESDLADLAPPDDADVRKLVTTTGLPESTLWAEVNRKVADVTGDAELGRLIGQLAHRGTVEQVWTWIRETALDGRPAATGPDAEPVHTDEKALRTLGTLTRMVTGRGRGFALIVDEADRLFSATSPDTDIGPFQELLECFARTGAFVVMCGASDYLRAIPHATRDRIGHSVTVDPMSRAETRELTRKVLDPGPDADLAPFTESTVDRLHEASGGNPRRFLRLCHYLYAVAGTRTAQPTGVVTDEVLAEAVRRAVLSVEPEEAAAQPRRSVDDEILLRLDAIERRLAQLAPLDRDSRADTRRNRTRRSR